MPQKNKGSKFGTADLPPYTRHEHHQDHLGEERKERKGSGNVLVKVDTKGGLVGEVYTLLTPLDNI